jgi:hypothetical protein
LGPRRRRFKSCRSDHFCPQGAQERSHRRHRLRRPGPGPGAQHARQRLQRHHRPVPAASATGTARSRTAGCPARPCSTSRSRQRGTIIQMLVSDAAQRRSGRRSRSLKPGDALYFSHGFSIVYKEADRRHPAQGRRRDPGRPQGLGHQRAPQLPLRRRHQLQLRRRARTPPAAPGALPGPRASASARATCSRPPSSRRSSAT